MTFLKNKVRNTLDRIDFNFRRVSVAVLLVVLMVFSATTLTHQNSQDASFATLTKTLGQVSQSYKSSTAANAQTQAKLDSVLSQLSSTEQQNQTLKNQLIGLGIQPVIGGPVAGILPGSTGLPPRTVITVPVPAPSGPSKAPQGPSTATNAPAPTVTAPKGSGGSQGSPGGSASPPSILPPVLPPVVVPPVVVPPITVPGVTTIPPVPVPIPSLCIPLPGNIVPPILAGTGLLCPITP